MKRTIFLWLLPLSFTARSQSGLTIQPATPFIINSGTLLSIDGLVLQPSVNFTLTAPNNLVRNSAITNPAYNFSINRAFKLSNTVNGFSGNISIYYLDGELNGLAEAGLTLNVHNGTSWKQYNMGITRDAANNFVTTAALANVNLNELTLASILAPLPLSWGPLYATRNIKKVLIKWSTYEELNTGFFEIERSIDGVHYSELFIKVPAVNAGGKQHYQAVDLQAPGVKTFYRIKETDQNGRTTYSPEVWVNSIDNNYDTEVTVYPNPASGLVNIQLASPTLYLRRIQLYSATGHFLTTGNHGNSTTAAIPIHHLPAGMYWLQTELSNGNIIWQSFIKQ